MEAADAHVTELHVYVFFFLCVCVCVCVCVGSGFSCQERSSHTEYESFSFFFERYLGYLCFFCQDVFIIALLLFSSSSNSLHLWISINCKNTSPLDDQLDKHKSLASGVMNIGETDHIFEDMSSF